MYIPGSDAPEPVQNIRRMAGTRHRKLVTLRQESRHIEVRLRKRLSPLESGGSAPGAFTEPEMIGRSGCAVGF